MIIVLDGVYSAGKSTLISAVAAHLSTLSAGPVMTTEWNSSDLVGDHIPEWKRDGRLGGHSLLFVEAADLAHRCEQGIFQHLAAGGVLVTDRWVLSGITRSVIRGVSPEFAAGVFEFAPRETVTVLVECAAEKTLARRKALGKRIGGYHSGRDYRASDDPEADFVRYQAEMAQLYRDLAPSRGPLVAVNTELPESVSIAQAIKGIAPFLPC